MSDEPDPRDAEVAYDASPPSPLQFPGGPGAKYYFDYNWWIPQPCDLDRARLRAALLPEAEVEHCRHADRGAREHRCAPLPPAAIRAEAETLERLWTLSGRLAPAAALILFDGCRDIRASVASEAELLDMAVWLGLLPAAPTPEAG